MIAQTFTETLLCGRSRKSDSSLLEMERPKKRVRISFEEPIVHRYATGQDDDRVSSGANAECQSPTNAQNEVAKSKCSPQKTSRLWLTRRDLAYVRSCAKKMCRSMNLDDVLQELYYGACSPHREMDPTIDRTSVLLKSKDYSEQRGLERWSTSQHSFLRSIKIVEVKTAVLLEQSCQFLTGKANPARLAEVSQLASSASIRFAQILAFADATMAMQIQKASHLPS
jgi:hypothetical protein